MPPESRSLATGDEHLRAGRLREAMAVYEALLRANASDPSIVDRVGLVLHAAKQPAQAAVAFARARQLDPRSADYAFHHGNALRECKEMAGAVAAYQAALEL